MSMRSGQIRSGASPRKAAPLGTEAIGCTDLAELAEAGCGCGFQMSESEKRAVRARNSQLDKWISIYTRIHFTDHVPNEARSSQGAQPTALT